MLEVELEEIGETLARDKLQRECIDRMPPKELIRTNRK